MSDKAMKKVSKSFAELSRSRAYSLAREEGGVIAVMLALMLTALLGMLALAMDLGKAWNLETELQHAADACALAGVTQLDGEDGARERAIEACVVDLAPALVDNEQSFASDGLGVDVTFSMVKTFDADGIGENPDIKFYINLPTIPANLATTDDEARFIEATVAPRTVDFSFAAVIGAVSSASPSARAVAGWEKLYCDKPQMMMCTPVDPLTGQPATDFDMYTDCVDYGDGRGPSCVGRGITLKEHGNAGDGQLFPSEYGFLSLSVLDSYGNVIEMEAGAKKLKEFLAAINSDARCTGNYSQTEPGNMTSLGPYINMRYDIYPDSNNPNYRYLENYRPAQNVVKNMVLPNDWSLGDRCRYNTVSGAPSGAGSSDWQWPAYRYKGPGHHMDAAYTAVDLNNIDILSTEEAATLDGFNFEDEDLVRYDPATSLYLDGSTLFGIPLPNVDAVHVLANGHIILSTEGAATIGALAFGPGDLVEYNPVPGTAILYPDFDSASFADPTVDIDAVHVLPDGHIVLSTAGPANLPGLGAFDKDDLVEYDPVALTATLYFDGGALFVPPLGDEDIDAVHIRANGHIILSTAGDVVDPNATLGGLTFGGDDLIDYDPGTGLGTDTATLYFDGQDLFAAADEDIDAIHILGQNSILNMGYPRDMCAFPPEAVAIAAGDPDIETVKDGYAEPPDTNVIYAGISGCMFAPKKNIADQLPNLDADQYGTGQWDIEVYMEVQHPGWLAAFGMDALITQADLLNILDNPTSKDGIVSRWEMHLWELLNYPNNMPEAYSGPVTAGTPICYEGGGYDPMAAPNVPVDEAVPDRLLMMVAVVNCADLGGGRQAVKRVPTHGNIALFLTEPMGGFDRDAIYAEIVDPAGVAAIGEVEALTLVRDHIVLIE